MLIPRRSFLRGLNLTVGGLALGYYFPVGRSKTNQRAGQAPGPKPVTGSQADGSEGPGPQSQCLHPRRSGRRRDHRLPSLGDGPRHPQFAARIDRG